MAKGSQNRRQAGKKTAQIRAREARRRRRRIWAAWTGTAAVVIAAAVGITLTVTSGGGPSATQESVAPGSAAALASAFPQPGDLTMGGRAGKVMVGLTVHPGRPGVNTVRVYLASPASAASRARLQVQGRWRALSFCGGPCRAATVDLRGGERLAVAVTGPASPTAVVAGPIGGTAVFGLPSLPARDGTALARSAIAQMNRLRSYQVAEVLSGFRSAYAYARPHQLWLRTWYPTGVQQSLWLGSSLYVKTSPGAPWQLKSKSTLAPVPYFNWYPYRPFVAARIIGTGTVSGVPVTVVSAFGGHGSDPESVWFTLSVDQKTGRVLRSQMWAPNHFMDDRYHAFNQPPRIPKPPAG